VRGAARESRLELQRHHSFFWDQISSREQVFSVLLNPLGLSFSTCSLLRPTSAGSTIAGVPYSLSPQNLSAYPHPLLLDRLNSLGRDVGPCRTATRWPHVTLSIQGKWACHTGETDIYGAERQTHSHIQQKVGAKFCHKSRFLCSHLLSLAQYETASKPNEVSRATGNPGPQDCGALTYFLRIVHTVRRWPPGSRWSLVPRPQASVRAK